MLISLYLEQSKYAKNQFQEIPSIRFIALELFCVTLYTVFFPIFIKSSSSMCVWYKHIIQNLMFLLQYVFEFMLIKDTQTHRPNEKMSFSDSGDFLSVNASKNPFWKFDPKTMLSLPLHGNEKIKM